MCDNNSNQRAYHNGNGTLSNQQSGFVSLIAREFKFNSIDDLAKTLGFSDSQEMARAESYSNIYEYFSSKGYVSRFLRMEGQLGDKGIYRY